MTVSGQNTHIEAYNAQTSAPRYLCPQLQLLLTGRKGQITDVADLMDTLRQQVIGEEPDLLRKSRANGIWH